MKTYLVTLITASMALALVGILSPRGAKDGIAKHMRLLTAFITVCILIAPLRDAIASLGGILSGDTELPWEEPQEDERYEQQMNEALQNASTSYFTQMLTEMLQSRFEIADGEIRCAVTWEQDNEMLSPVRVTVILSGRAIWKDPAQIEAFVSELLGCECVSAIE